MLLEVVGPLALLEVEVLGYSKMLEKTPDIFVPECGIKAAGVFMAKWLEACLTRLGYTIRSSLLKGHCHRRQGGC